MGVSKAPNFLRADFALNFDRCTIAHGPAVVLSLIALSPTHRYPIHFKEPKVLLTSHQDFPLPTSASTSASRTALPVNLKVWPPSPLLLGMVVLF